MCKLKRANGVQLCCVPMAAYIVDETDMLLLTGEHGATLSVNLSEMTGTTVTMLQSCVAHFKVNLLLCRQGQWWEASASQIKLTALLLIVVIGRPLGTYIQSLILIAMLAFELQYEATNRPIRFVVVQRLQLATIVILFMSLLVSLFTADFQSTASPTGLRALAVLTIIGNLGLCLLFVWYIVRGYKDEVAAWVIWGRQRLSQSFSRHASHSGFKQFVTNVPARMGRRQPSGDPFLTSNTTSPARTSSVEMSRAPSGYSPGDMRRSSSILSSQELAAIWSSTNTTRAPER